MKLSNFAIIVLIFCTVLIVYHFSIPTVADSRWNIPTAMSIIDEGNTDLDEYKQLLEDNDYYQIEVINGHYYSRFPIGPSVIAVPFVLFYNFFRNFDESIKTTIPSNFEAGISSVIVALTAVFIFLVTRISIKRVFYAAMPALLFAFCTSAWSIAGLALWQHTPSILMLTIALYFILLEKTKPGIIQYASIPLAFSYVVRPTNSISIILLTLYIVIQYRKYLIRYLLWSLVIAIPFIVFNLAVYGSFLSNYYQPNRLGSNQNILVALAGNLISPSRGLIIFSPVLLFAILGIWLKIKSRQFERLDYFIIGIIVFHWFTISTFDPWWAGHTFGPRFFTDLIPYFIYFIIPVFSFLAEQRSAWNPVIISVLVITATFSLFVQHRGATCEQVQDWNVHPNIGDNQQRLWDWGDISFSSGIRHNLFNCKKNWTEP